MHGCEFVAIGATATRSNVGCVWLRGICQPSHLVGACLLMCGPDLQETLAMYSILFSLLHVVRAGWGGRRVHDSIIHIVELSHPHAPLGIVG